MHASLWHMGVSGRGGGGSQGGDGVCQSWGGGWRREKVGMRVFRRWLEIGGGGYFDEEMRDMNNKENKVMFKPESDGIGKDQAEKDWRTGCCFTGSSANQKGVTCSIKQADSFISQPLMSNFHGLWLILLFVTPPPPPRMIIRAFITFYG